MDKDTWDRSQCWDSCGWKPFGGEGSKIFHFRYHQRKRPSEELKFTQCSRSVYGPCKIYQKNVRCQWIVLNVNIIQLATSISYCSLARSSHGSPVWRGVSGGVLLGAGFGKVSAWSVPARACPLTPTLHHQTDWWVLRRQKGAWFIREAHPNTSATTTATTRTPATPRLAASLGRTPAGRGVGGRGCFCHLCLHSQGLGRLALPQWGGRQCRVVSPTGDAGRKDGVYWHCCLLGRGSSARWWMGSGNR